ncbi:hypothetical protein D3Z38_04865 [Clostridiales bacterium]|nr:hypothetical protein [Clostridiales bacterium]
MRKILSMVLILAFCLSLPQPVFGAAEHRGIDVSQWQGSINYRQVKNAGIRIVYIKAGEGSGSVDPYFERNYRAAKRAGLDVGFYHYVTARTVAEGRRQARFFTSLIQTKKMECRPAMDFEQVSGLSRDEANAIARAYLRELYRLTKCRPIVYSNAYDAHVLWDQSLTRYPLWIADYGVREPYTTGKWRHWQGFQYDDKGEVRGIHGHVDLNRFRDGVYLKDLEKRRMLAARLHCVALTGK